MKSSVLRHISVAIIFGIFSLVIACGANLSQYPNKDLRGGEGGGDALPGGDCKMVEPSQALKDAGFVTVEINKLGVKLNEESKVISLCEMLKNNNSKTAVVQFAGVTCLSCQDEAELFTTTLAPMQSAGLAHIVAITDRFMDYPREAFNGFMQNYAPNGILVHDQDSQGVPTLWKHFSKNSAYPVRPTVIAFNSQGIGYVINEEGGDVHPIFNKAIQLINLEKSGNQLPEEDPVNEEPQIPPLNLKPGQNLDLRRGNNTNVKLADLFEKEYLVIDISQFNCTYCRQLANKHQTDTAFQQLMLGQNKCRTVTIVPNADVSSWIGAYPFSTFVGSTSAGTSQSLFTIATAFGITNFRGTPTVVVIDRNGNKVAEQVGGSPASLTTLCRAN